MGEITVRQSGSGPVMGRRNLLRAAGAVGLGASVSPMLTGCLWGSGGGAGNAGDMSFLSPGEHSSAEKEVVDAVNAKLQGDGVDSKLSIVKVPWDQWDQKSTLMMATGQPVGLVQVMQDLKTAGQLRAKNAIVPLNDHLKDFPDLIRRFPPGFWNEVTHGGEILAVPAWTTNKDDKQYGEIYYRKDVLDRTGLGVPTTVDQIIRTGLRIQAQIKKETGRPAYAWQPIVRPPKWLHRTYDRWPFYVDTTPGVVMVTQDGAVHSWVESDEFRTDAEVHAELNQHGLIYPNVLSAPENYANTQGDFGIYVWGFESFDYQSNYSSLRQNNPKATMGDFFLEPDKGHFQYFYTYNANAVPATSKDPVAALKFLDWLYRSKENHDLFNYGIEGKTYNVPSGRPDRYAPVLGANGKPVYAAQDWMWMISFIDYRRFEEGTPDFIVDQQRLPAKGRVSVSPVAGFQFDATKVAQIAAGLEQVVKTEIWPIKFGFRQYQQAFPRALARLKSTGLDKYLAEYERQLKEFLAFKQEHPRSVAHELIS